MSQKIIEKRVEIKAYSFYNLLTGRIEYVPTHNLTYLESGDPQNENVIFCAHGLTRNAHDFDILALELAKSFRVISINYPGRDTSDYFSNGKNYNYPTYCEETKYFFAQLGLNTEKVIWIGTSMGGIIGMYYASQGKCKALILNDVGSFISSESLHEIKKYTSADPKFNHIDEAKNYLKTVYKVGDISEKHWDHLTKHSVKKKEDELYHMNYDLEIVKNIPVSHLDVDLRILWNQVQCSVLVISGEESKVLEDDTIKMMKRNKKISVLEVENAGHAPSLMTDDQINFINQWIDDLPKDSIFANNNAMSFGFLYNQMMGANPYFNQMMKFFV